jgi:hypothetical protein
MTLRDRRQGFKRKFEVSIHLYVTRRNATLKGDLAQFAPADLLLFLCHMNKEGVLTARAGGEVLSFGFPNQARSGASGDRTMRLEFLSPSCAGSPPAPIDAPGLIR